jgi:hypothetical protein
MLYLKTAIDILVGQKRGAGSRFDRIDAVFHERATADRKKMS